MKGSVQTSWGHVHVLFSRLARTCQECGVDMEDIRFQVGEWMQVGVPRLGDVSDHWEPCASRVQPAIVACC